MDEEVRTGPLHPPLSTPGRRTDLPGAEPGYFSPCPGRIDRPEASTAGAVRSAKPPAAQAPAEFSAPRRRTQLILASRSLPLRTRRAGVSIAGFNLEEKEESVFAFMQEEYPLE